MRLRQLNLHALTYRSVIKLQAFTCTRFLLQSFSFKSSFVVRKDLLFWVLCCDTDTLPVWCNPPVAQWQDCPIKGCPPAAVSQNDCTVVAKRHPYIIAAFFFCLLTGIDSWDKLRLLRAASSQPCGNGSAGLQLEKGMFEN